MIEAAQAHLKYMIAGNAAAIVALIAFIYDSGGIARTSVVLKIITVVAAVALLKRSALHLNRQNPATPLALSGFWRCIFSS